MDALTEAVLWSKIEERQTDYDTVRFKVAGHTLEVMWAERMNRIQTVQKLDKDHYCLTVGECAGEVREYKHIDSRADEVVSLRRTFASIRDLINCNVTEPQNCKWVTLTYRENMTDTKRLCKDFNAWTILVRRHYPGMEYIGVAEPQERGAWHMHVLMVWQGPAPYIPQKAMRDWWLRRTGPSGGSVVVKAVKDGGDNLGAYLSAYLGDVEVPDGKPLPPLSPGTQVKVIKGEDGHTKRYIKGGRLHLYPPGFNICRPSRGVKRPEIDYVAYGEAKKKVGAATLTRKKPLAISDTATGFSNLLSYEYYNIARKCRSTLHL